ncbi:hypothetical protein GCM10007987_25690 [Aliivibrio fischeri]|nr:hypothetical protein GCM10007987_25690 [Aliivibrio fischeri]
MEAFNKEDTGILKCLRWYGSTPMSYANLRLLFLSQKAAYQFLKHYLRYYDQEQHPKTLNTDKHSSYANAIAHLKKEG